MIWVTPSNFTFLWWHQCHSRLVMVFLGNFSSFIKQIKAPYVFDWEHGITVHAMQGNWTSSLGEWEVSCFFSSCVEILGYIHELRRGCPFKTRVCSATSGLLSSNDGYLTSLDYAGQDNTDASRSEEWNRGSLSSWHSDIGIHNNIQEGSGIIKFWSTELSVPLDVSKRCYAPCRDEVLT